MHYSVGCGSCGTMWMGKVLLELWVLINRGAPYWNTLGGDLL